MHKLVWISALLMLTATGGANACAELDTAECRAAALLADAGSEERLRYRDGEQDDSQGPLSVRVTTFDGSPSSPGMWYERPRSNGEEEAMQQRPDIQRAPFDRQFDRPLDRH